MRNRHDSVVKSFALVTSLALALAACSAQGGGGTTPTMQAPSAAGDAHSRFSTNDLPSEHVPGAETVALSGTTHGPIHRDVSSTATETAITFFSSPQYQSYPWLDYNIQVDYSDGTSVIAYAPDGNSLFVRNPDKSSTEFDVQFVNQNGNVFLTMLKTAEIAAPTPAPSSPPVHTPPPCIGNRCTNLATYYSGALHADVSCTAVLGLAGAFGLVLGTAATDGTFMAVGAIVGSFLGPGGMAAGALMGAYAANAIGASELGSAVGASVLGAVAYSLCEESAPQAGHAALNGNGPPDYNTPNIPPWPDTPVGVSGSPTTFSSCCYPL